MAELKLNTNKIFELADYISRFLHENGINGEKELKVYVSKDELRKIDEDLFYRNKSSEEEHFEPSSNEVVVNYHNFVLKFILFKNEEKT